MRKVARRTSTTKTRLKKRVRKRGRGERAPKFVPVKVTGKKIEAAGREEGGALGWLLPMMEASYTQLKPRGAAMSSVKLAKSRLQLSGEAFLAPASPTTWRDIFVEFRQRKAAALAPALGVPSATRAAPIVPGGRNWLPLGPSVVLNGIGDQPVGGRVSGLAIAPGGAVVYAASANGGVFRSTDGATTWQSMMDGFDLDPTHFASASLACGAIAIDPADPNRVYVGTGEGDTFGLFRLRLIGALPAYRGVGPISSDDGGSTWSLEPSLPDLAGEAFFALAVDPRDRDNVLGATSKGLYRRVPKPRGQFEWTRVRPEVHASVVVASGGGVTRFFAAEWGEPGGPPSAVFHSDDGGATWAATGNGLPTADAGRIALGVQPANPNLVYAFIAEKRDALALGLFRLDGVTATWKKAHNLPDVVPTDNGRGQLDYDIAIAVDPANPDLVYLGGSYADLAERPASIWRCTIDASQANPTIQSSVLIGSRAHADVHVLMHTPGNSDELWCGCDGGVFLNRDPRASGEFASQNNGLACLCCNFIAQHATDPNILFTGMQDNGTARTASGPIWSHVSGGDGGYCLINWAEPSLVLVFATGSVLRSTTGGTSPASWSTGWLFGSATMTPPIVGTPRDPDNPANAGLVAAAAGPTILVSTDFAASWPMRITFPGGADAGQIFALAFPSATRLYAGTTRGRVFRCDRSGSTWSVTRLDDAAAGPLGLEGLITDVAVDWSDASLGSIYIAFGGMGDRRRVWRFDGTKWEVRSGSGTNALLDVEHNALVVDRAAPANLYAGADIGVWHSSDGGLTWAPLQNGLPDAPVFDLQIHPTQRLLRAATHGRGVYELALD
jgi:photosystem II stability/assembly factor-like uncharacterized protein